MIAEPELAGGVVVGLEPRPKVSRRLEEDDVMGQRHRSIKVRGQDGSRGGSPRRGSSFSRVSQPDEQSRYYNELAGSSLHRLSGLSDGIFAVAMTLLVLALAVPTIKEVSSDSDLWQALLNLVPGLVTYFMSFLTLGIFWVGQQTQLSQLERSNRDYTWINLAFLLFVTLVPFSTQPARQPLQLAARPDRVLAEHPGPRDR